MNALFGYGSLLFAPELPDALVDRRIGVVHGLARRFNKRSDARGCATGDAMHPATAVAGFERDGWRWSLALGTAAEPGAVMIGALLIYRDDVAAELQARMDRREQYNAAHPEACGYLRVRVEVEVDGGRSDAWTYVSNPGGRYHVGDLSMQQTAQVLAHGTPVDPSRMSGLRYLDGVRRSLVALGAAPDAYLEALAAAAIASWG